ncbi:hypothetical protein MC7420_7971 [Coleofasciculus chthonoplastes PCC 7420]|uniref:Uncharacterized protein n=1 Tax=Coleofasciculus chthonoplastes PCC 7420 TaxID=118168 RepID=B4VJ13_9CYAN|nr:hypothetical protein MC7420_7799 [Coleofasciculus chthonoplastes PCC 7420]EDX78233.1 hypothetical protein MC7420_7971 [Coleofasciculus chthonoplastes PCC 7420]
MRFKLKKPLSPNPSPTLGRGEQECRGGFRDSIGWLNDN